MIGEPLYPPDSGLSKSEFIANCYHGKYMGNGAAGSSRNIAIKVSIKKSGGIDFLLVFLEGLIYERIIECGKGSYRRAKEK